MNAKLGIFKTKPSATTPSFATQQSACFDISACLTDDKIKAYSALNQQIEIDCCSFDENNTPQVTIPSYFRVLIPTGLVFDIPKGYSIRIHPRSGLSFKQGIVLANSEGVIDSDYIHECFIMVKNDSLDRVTIKHGDRIAQGELVKSLDYTIEECYTNPVQKTDRNGGFGSTGV
jgi:dUTP pyrophosphatase